MRAGWQTKALSQVCEFQRGLTYSKADEVDISDNIVLRAMNIDLASHELDLTELKYISDKIVVPGNKKVKKDSLMICTASGSKKHLGKIAYIDDDYGYAFGGFMGMLTPKTGIVPKYLFYLMTSADYENFIGALADGMNINNLKFDELKKFQVPYPEPREQHRIVDILDKAFDGIGAANCNAKENLKNARALLTSYRESIFVEKGAGWTTRPLADLCDIKHGFAFKSQFFTDTGDYVMLTPGNFFESGGYRDRGEKQKYYCGEIPRDYVLDRGDLLVAMTEQATGLLGAPIIVPESEKFLHNQRLGLVTRKTGIPWTNEFFFHVFNTRDVRKAIHDSASGVKVRHTSPKKIGNVMVSFPTSVSQQQEVVSRLTTLDEEAQRLESIYLKKLSAFDALKKSLLHHAFAGKL